MAVSFKEVTKRFADGTVALDRLDLDFDLGAFIVLLGPSGSGKTTACRLLAGLEQPSSGRIEIEGRDVTNVPPRFRGIGMVFQNYALYSHKTVFENIAYPLRIRKVAAAEIERSVKDMAELLRIAHYLQRKPAQLSGGQAQRVAVARALVWQPAICLMDEPLSNLDALLRLHMRTELNRLHRKLDKTFVFVTHDQEEAMTLATRIAVLKEGRLVQFDEPKTIYRRPANRFVAEFMGRPAMNTIDGVVKGGIFKAGAVACSVDRPDGPVTLGIRPEQIEFMASNAPAAMTLTVDVKEAIEPDTLLIFQNAGGQAITLRTQTNCDAIEPGQPVSVSFPKQALHYFDAATGKRVE
ncbi:ABC transporter ATP-binding protein [Mesorhizobium sp.]|uniref:ABC transporter ATP-binding protein n=1 Tax=Mesorhizobium sp. TaxID=1871066 RepID=UPI000FE32AA2|nr:ABC transporter ATP-binding protein [Mesorhizobium sp.]RWN60577.1 MAG: ABC transporter ATP-binding protein [Mesorhizobium sp.]RWO28543.1 MAG: ABC transporter ATP-binding protein [Mesorhizobium sp.]RWO45080.1 MAG: ABC transporter ATP-binding protein [Mesorhizobium sp.]RWO51822.1 MAG: ABC transporter ATP-binding protein [Mesorhizobium sp.]TIL34159.1 MAG: ATP-binding cassette domain-containing protein [Mesorhizobium sp.]